MAIVVDQPQRVADWVGYQMGTPAPTIDAAIGYESCGQLRAGVYFDAMSESNINCHIASTTDMLPHTLIRAVAQYCFSQVGLKRITFPIPADNIVTIKFVRDMGAQLECVMAEAAGDYDLYLFVLWRGDPYPQRMLNSGSH
jgi:hypothetical protein